MFATTCLNALRACLLLAPLLACAGGAQAQAVVDDGFCRQGDLPPALRQTLVVIDGRLVIPEPDGKPREENQGWRRFAGQFADPLASGAGQRLDARERVTLAVANADGSGLTVLFAGCVPLYRPEEEARLEASSSTLGWFVGSDWRSALKKAGEEFRRKATLAMVSGVKGLPAAGENAGGGFAQGSLARSLARGTGLDLARGVPRVVIYTDLGLAAFPKGEVRAARAAARAEAEAAGLDLQRAEVHLFGAPGTPDTVPKNALEAYFLTGRARLASLAAMSGALPADPPPREVAVYQGTVRVGSEDYPVRMRLARDQNGTVVNSWLDMQLVQDRFAPFRGILTCSGKECRYVGDKSFAQIWPDNPDPAPQFEKWMPFGGMRDLRFTVIEDRVEGTIRDEVGYVVGQEQGLPFTLTRVPNGVF